jgi:hypothetical protein
MQRLAARPASVWLTIVWGRLDRIAHWPTTIDLLAKALTLYRREI